jgi:hypothetical protein
MDSQEPGSGPPGAHNRTSRFVKGTNIVKPPNNDGAGVISMLKHPMCSLLVCFPLGLISNWLNWGSASTFSLNFLALIPLAKILGDATEELAAGLKNDMIAGLLNATFGNAVEVVMMVQTLRAGMIPVVKATLLGSVLSNLLLVLGMSFFCGGIVSYRKTKRKNAMSTVIGELPPQAQGSRAPRNSTLLEGDGTTSSSSLNRRNSGRKILLATSENEVEEQHAEHDLAFAGEVIQSFSIMTALVNTSMLLLSCLSFSLVTVFYTQTQSMTGDGCTP